ALTFSKYLVCALLSDCCSRRQSGSLGESSGISLGHLPLCASIRRNRLSRSRSRSALPWRNDVLCAAGKSFGTVEGWSAFACGRPARQIPTTAKDALAHPLAR